MKKFQVLLIISVSLFLETSCMPKRPYEIKSPCVSIESNDPHIVTPCIRRPANSNIIL